VPTVVIFAAMDNLGQNACVLDEDNPANRGSQSHRASSVGVPKITKGGSLWSTITPRPPRN
jgi:hypothetical protein